MAYDHGHVVSNQPDGRHDRRQSRHHHVGPGDVDPGGDVAIQLLDVDRRRRLPILRVVRLLTVLALLWASVLLVLALLGLAVFLAFDLWDGRLDVGQHQPKPVGAPETIFEGGDDRFGPIGRHQNLHGGHPLRPGGRPHLHDILRGHRIVDILEEVRRYPHFDKS